MPYKLKRPGFIGSYLEYLYDATIPVTAGECVVEKPAHRDTLLQRGFIEIPLEEPAEPAVVSVKPLWKTKRAKGRGEE